MIATLTSDLRATLAAPSRAEVTVHAGATIYTEPAAGGLTRFRLTIPGEVYTANSDEVESAVKGSTR